MRLLDKTYLTEDEGYNVEGAIGESVEAELKSLKLDTYNRRYTVRVTVDRVDDLVAAANDDDAEGGGGCIMIIASGMAPADWLRVLGLLDRLTDNQRGRLAGVQITKELGRPLTVDLRLAADGGGHRSMRWVMGPRGWIQAGTEACGIAVGVSAPPRTPGSEATLERGQGG